MSFGLKDIIKKRSRALDDDLMRQQNGYLFDCKKVLDVGCGDGRLMKIIQRLSKGTKMAGLDLHKPSIKKAKEAGLDVRVANSQKLPFPTGSFDGVLCNSVFNHLYREEIGKTMEEIRRVLKPQGKLVISVSLQYEWGKDYDWEHVTPYSKEKLDDALRYFNFKIEKRMFDRYNPPLRSLIPIPVTLLNKLMSHKKRMYYVWAKKQDSK